MKLNRMQRLCRLWVLLMTVGLAGCVISPQPNPPIAPQPGEFPVALERVHLQTSGNGMLRLWGEQAALADESRIVIANLERSEPPVVVQPAADNSFSVELAGNPGDPLYLQGNVAVRWAPKILTAAADGTVQEAGWPCVTVGEWLLSLYEGESPRSSSLTNECGEELSLESLRLHREQPGWTLGAARDSLVQSPPLALPFETAVRIDAAYDFTASDTAAIAIVTFTAADGRRGPVALTLEAGWDAPLTD